MYQSGVKTPSRPSQGRPGATMANACAVITVEGILQTTIGAAPIITGINLYKGLAETFTVVLLSEQKQETVDYWLRIENLNQHSLVLYSAPILDNDTEEVYKLRQLNKLRARGFSVDLAFDPNPSVCAHYMTNGYNACCFLNSTYADPKWRPDYEETPRSWDDMVEAAIAYRITRNKDLRLKKKDAQTGDDE